MVSVKGDNGHGFLLQLKKKITIVYHYTDHMTHFDYKDKHPSLYKKVAGYFQLFETLFY